MKHILFTLIPATLTLITGCATVEKVVQDPGVQAAAATTVEVAKSVAIMSNPELAGILVGAAGLAGAVAAYLKARKK